MAGHSQFKNIMHRKGAQDIKRAKIFAKISREIMVSVKTGGADHTANPRLRAALSTARAANMPKDNIDRAIKKVLGGEDQANFEEIRYEGYGPGGVAVIVETLTDNRNRSASEVRSCFTKYGGSLGETNSVSFMFERIGLIKYEKTMAFDDLFEGAVNAGADDVAETDENFEVTCAWEDFGSVRDNLMESHGDPVEGKIVFRPVNTNPLNLDTAKSFLKMIDVLEDNDDVQNVYSNADIPDEILEQLT